MTSEEFIKRAKEIHGVKYNYSKVEYVDWKTKVCIICPKHGEFWQKPINHILRMQGCKKCATELISKKKTYTIEEFIDKARKIHGNKYDYSKVEYNGTNTKVCIICPLHGEFWQTPNNHLQGRGCKECKKNIIRLKQYLGLNDFIKKAKQVHGDKYDYSKVEYFNNRTKVCIVCPIHGEFWQTPDAHLRGEGCQKCHYKKLSILKTKEDSSFIEQANKVHNFKYEYSKVKYVNSDTKICIICPQHGEFWQLPSNHLQGKGCPKCNSSHLENEIGKMLECSYINAYSQHKFDWLCGQSLDFYIPSKNIAIECQGIQHFKPIDFANKGKEWAEQNYKKIIEYDEKKRKLCEEHGIKLLYYSNLGIDYPYHVFEDKNELLSQIT